MIQLKNKQDEWLEALLGFHILNKLITYEYDSHSHSLKIYSVERNKLKVPISELSPEVAEILELLVKSKASQDNVIDILMKYWRKNANVSGIRVLETE